MQIDWQRKFASRKFWALIAGLATSIMVLLGAGESEITKIAGLVGAIGSVAVYIYGESAVDAAAVKKEDS